MAKSLSFDYADSQTTNERNGEFYHKSKKVETREFIVARMTNGMPETTDYLSYLTIFLAFVS